MNADASGETAHLAHAEGSPMRIVLETAERIAPSDAGILIVGERGTGKEALARRIHSRSGRAGPFVVVRCGSLDENGALRDVFGHGGGHVRGEAAGAFRAATGGTLFLEDIAGFPRSAQAALASQLRRSSHGDTRRPVRAIATSTANIAVALREGRLRRDLYDSLACSIEVPPLRARPDDAVAIFRHLLEGRGGGTEVAADALHFIRHHGWPGNVPELEAFASGLALMTGTVESRHADLVAQLEGLERVTGVRAAVLMETVRASSGGSRSTPRERPAALALPAIMERLEYAIIDWALEVSGGNRKAAGDLLGLHRTTLVEKLRRRDKGGRGAPPSSRVSAALASMVPG